MATCLDHTDERQPCPNCGMLHTLADDLDRATTCLEIAEIEEHATRARLAIARREWQEARAAHAAATRARLDARRAYNLAYAKVYP